MTGRNQSLLVVSIFIVLILLVALNYQFQTKKPQSIDWQTSSFSKKKWTDNEHAPVAATTNLSQSGKTAIWFTGDVMLSRQVGQLAHARGNDYPWRGLGDVFSTSSAYTVINFEGCTTPTKHFDEAESYRFAVASEALVGAHEAGVTHAGLANNHALDCGLTGHVASYAELEHSGIVPFGHPTEISSTSVTYLQLTSHTIGILAIHLLYGEPTLAELQAQLAVMNSHSDTQIAFIHWGSEYETTATARQRAFAQTLADAGIDIIIGHHPHVVEEISTLGSTLVLYSLGNLIFDQYFSTAVQTGLVLKLVAEQNGHTTLELHPVTSEDTRTQPRFMEGQPKQTFLTTLAKRSIPTLAAEITAGRLDITNYVATSTKRVMIAR